MYERIRQPKLADVIEAELEQMIVEGSLLPGQRLPPERELAQKFAVSRPSIRAAIQRLEGKGLVLRKQGGGTFVCEQLQQGLTDPLFSLLAQHPELHYDLLEFRHALEGISAYYAALRGTAADFAAIESTAQRIKEAHGVSIEQEAQAVVDFYLAVAMASHNALFWHLAQGMQQLLLNNIRQNFTELYRSDDNAAALLAHREKLMAAILNRDPQGAREACHRHLAFIEEALLQLRQEDSRHQRSMRRLQHRQTEIVDTPANPGQPKPQ